MPATSKTELLRVTDKEFAKLADLIERVPVSTAVLKDEDGTSIQDVVAHRGHWIGLFLGWYDDGQAGLDVAFPAPGYKWNQLPEYNAALREQQAGMSWDDAVNALHQANERLRRFLESRTEVELYGGPMKGAKNNWTTGRWAEAAGPSHYRSAAKYIRAALRRAAD